MSVFFSHEHTYSLFFILSRKKLVMVNRIIRKGILNSSSQYFII